jgi:hypothetical protein
LNQFENLFLLAQNPPFSIQPIIPCRPSRTSARFTFFLDFIPTSANFLYGPAFNSGLAGLVWPTVALLPSSSGRSSPPMLGGRGSKAPLVPPPLIKRCPTDSPLSPFWLQNRSLWCLLRHLDSLSRLYISSPSPSISSTLQFGAISSASMCPAPPHPEARSTTIARSHHQLGPDCLLLFWARGEDHLSSLSILKPPRWALVAEAALEREL